MICKGVFGCALIKRLLKGKRRTTLYCVVRRSLFPAFSDMEWCHVCLGVLTLF